MQSKSCVIVDDDEGYLLLLKQLLLRHKIDVIAAESDGKNGLNAISQLSPDFILIDMYMPNLSGTELIELIRDLPNKGEIPICLLTAQNPINVAQFIPDRVHVIQKPVEEIEQLIPRIMRLLSIDMSQIQYSV